MITLHLHNDTHIALRGAFDYRTQIKALADRPDVRWDADTRAWLLHVALLDKLFLFLGDAIAPASPAFWMDCPLPAPTPAQVRRRTKREAVVQRKIEQAAAAVVGSAIVDNREELTWR